MVSKGKSENANANSRPQAFTPHIYILFVLFLFDLYCSHAAPTKSIMHGETHLRDVA